jgi:hypothetical protein
MKTHNRRWRRRMRFYARKSAALRREAMKLLAEAFGQQMTDKIAGPGVATFSLTPPADSDVGPNEYVDQIFDQYIRGGAKSR